MDPMLRKSLAQTIYVAQRSGIARASGQPQWGSPAATSARVEPSTKLIYGSSGTAHGSSHCVVTATRVRMGDLVWLPGADSSVRAEAKEPLRVDELSDERGTVHHYEVWL